MRGDMFAAFCAGAGPGTGLFQGAPPRSVFMIAGEKDQLVSFASMKFSIESARRLLKTDSEKAKSDGLLKTELNSDGIELATYLHPGGHEWPKDATPLVVKFFQRHALK
jgi:polyhydroxybutyrate depolymerase